MNEAIKKYLSDIQEQFASGQAIEHAYRPALKTLMSSFEDIIAVNDPRHSEHGAPDFVFIQKSNTKIFKGYAEAKDIGVKLDKVEKSNQMERYSGYDNLFLTDYLEFRFFKNGEKYETVSLGAVKNGKLLLSPENGQLLYDELASFLRGKPEQIRSGKRLAVIMGGYARRIRGNVSRFLSTENEKNESLEKIFGKMKELLVHDLDIERFADMYAQTLVYGLFVGRYNDTSLDDFTRHEAQQNIPRSNPFLRHFFDHIAGIDFDERLAVVVDELCAVFAVSDVRHIIEKHLRLFETENDRDPLIHFYEDFLKEYDPTLRKKMGAYYTPTPVVHFIIREVDRILKEDFDIAEGIASSEMVDREVETQPWRLPGERKDRTTKQIKSHRVQILDPAVGTATFLNETIKYIYEQKRETQAGTWSSYVKEHLVPRLFGFELMMAPYTIAHLKLGMTLQETGVKDLGDERLNIYLTNTLEEGVPLQNSFDFGLSEAISTESRLAADIKTTQPIMIVMGNPPYSGVSSNETKYANSLIQKYKVEPGGQQKLQERKHWLNDDYVKFIAFAEDMIAKNGSGIMAMITNNGYLDNPTFRGMRWHLTQTFDKIYVLDLHGNAKKKEVAPDGGKDENVFNIMQGVSIILAVKTAAQTLGAAEVYHTELYGRRGDKLSSLSSFQPIWPLVRNKEIVKSFAPKSSAGEAAYNKGIKLSDLFVQDVTGIVTARDSVVIDIDRNSLLNRINQFSDATITDIDIRRWLFPHKKDGKYLAGDSRGWKLESARKVLRTEVIEGQYTYSKLQTF
jgi:type I restriction-modification system DNA methylase subunit